MTAVAIRALPRDRAEDAFAGPPQFVLVTAGFTVALLPLLRPMTPGNTGPIDLFLALNVAAFAAWAMPLRVQLGFPYSLAMALTIVAGGVAGLFADESASASVSLPLLQDIWLLAGAAVLFNIARTPAAIRRLAEIWCASAIVWAIVLVGAVVAGLDGISGINERTGSRAALTLGDSNYAANYFLLSLAMIAAFGYPRRLLGRLGAYSVLLLCVLLTGSNGGIFSAVAVVIGLSLATVHRRWGVAAALLCTSLVAVWSLSQASACLDATTPVVSRKLCLIDPNELVATAKASDIDLVADSLGRAGQSTSQRGELLTESAALYRRNSLLGIGPAQTKAELRRELAPFVKEAHNDYAAALIERGWLGGVALLTLLITVGKRAAPVFRGRLDPRWRAVVPRPEALLAGALVVAVAGWFYEVLHLRHLWAFLALVAAIGHWGAPAPAVPPRLLSRVDDLVGAESTSSPPAIPRKRRRRR